MDVVAELRRSGRVLEARVDRDVAAALARVDRYTVTELREVELGLRESEADRAARLAEERLAESERRAREAAEAFGRGLRELSDSLHRMVDGIRRGFYGGAR